MIFREYRILRITDSDVANKIKMRFIFGLLVSLVIVYTYYYEVQSVELRCPCTDGFRNPLFGLFLIGHDPPHPPVCERDQFFLKPPQGKTVCLGPEHHLSSWVKGQNSSLWHKILVTKKGDEPQVQKRGEYPRNRARIIV